MKKPLLSLLSITLLSFVINAQTNIGLISVTNPTDACSHMNETITALLNNAGGDTILTGDTITMSYAINGGTTVNDTLFLSSDFLPSDSLTFSFVTPADFSTTGSYSIVVACNFGNDTISSDDTISTTIQTYGYPTTIISSDTTICEGENVTLTVSGGNTYLWNTSDTLASIVVSPTDTINYTVTTTDTNGCQVIDTVVVNVNPIPTITFNVTDTSDACQGTPVNITVSGGNTYYWNTGDTTASIIANPTDTTTYSVTVSLNGCTASDSVLVNLITPAYTLIPDTFVCDGDSITLFADNGESYVWSSGDSSETAAILPTISAEYFITVTDANGCSFFDSVLVDVHAIPTINTDYADTTICSGFTVTATASGADSYIWNNNAAYDSATSNIAQLTPMTTTIYYVYGTTLGCTASATVTVNVLQSPDLNLEDEYNITEDNVLVLGVTGGYATYNWSNGETDEMIVLDGSVLGTGTYTYWVNATASNGCFSTDTTTVIIADGVGFDENDAQNQIKIYPNPSSGTVFIESSKFKLTYSISDITGKVIFTNTIYNSKEQIDLSKFEKGIYFIQLKNNNKIITTKKLILQ